MQVVYNIDWLEVYCLESSNLFPMNATFFESQGWNVRRREYGTRVYKEMFTLLDNEGYPFIEIRRHPMSEKSVNGGIFDEKSCHIRLSNYYCYHDEPINVLRQFLVRYDYILIRIFRIDICADFEKFIKGDDPAKFIQRYMNGRYSKVNQANINAHGVDRWDGRTWNSLSWGKPKSMIGTKMYCKTLELEQVHDKPYIKHSWWMNGLIDNPISCTKKDASGNTYKPDIWRVEFSIHSSAKKWFLIERADTRKENVQPMPHTLDIYDNRYKLAVVFASLAQHYFHFKIFEEGKRKDRCKDKELFDFAYITEYYKVDRLASHTPTTPKLKRLIMLLQNYADTTLDQQVQQAINIVIQSIKARQTTEHAGKHYDARELLILQRLIAERSKGCREKSITEQRKAIENAIDTYNEYMFG